MKRAVLLLIAGACCYAQSPGGCSIEVVAGRSASALRFPDVALRHPVDRAAIAVNGDGQLFVTDSHVRVLRLDGPLLTLVVGGDPLRPAAGDAVFQSISAVLAAPDGSLIIADGNRIRRAATDGTVTDIAGSTTAGFRGDGGPAVSARLSAPIALALASDGSLLIGDNGNFRIRRIDLAGNIDTIAGTGGGDPKMGDDGPAVEARIGPVASLAQDSNGSVYFIESFFGAARLRVVDSKGLIHTLLELKDKAPAADPDSVDVSAANLSVSAVINAALDQRVYIADQSTLRVLSSDGKLVTLQRWMQKAPLHDLAVAKDGTAYWSTDLEVYGLTPGGVPALLIGNDRSVPLDGVPALAATLAPIGLARDSAGSLYISDSSEAVVLRLKSDGTLTRVWKAPTDYLDPLSSAPGRIQFDSKGRLVLVVGGRIWRLDANGAAQLLAGGGSKQVADYSGPGSDFGGFFGTSQLGLADDGRLFAIDGRYGILYEIAEDGSMNPVWPGLASPPPGSTSNVGVPTGGPVLRHPDGSFLIGGPQGILQFSANGNGSVIVENVTRNNPPDTAILELIEEPNSDLVYLDADRLSLHVASTGDVSRYVYLDGYRRNWGVTQSNGLGTGAVIAPDGQGNLYLINGPANQVELLHNYRACMAAPVPEVSFQSLITSTSSSGVAPGSRMTLSGTNLGPLDQINAVEDDHGRLPFELGGIQVTVDNRPAPILSAQNTSLTFQIPYGLDVDAVQARQNGYPYTADLPIVISYKGTAAPAFSTFLYRTYPVLQLAPGQTPQFNQTPYAFARNSDGTINSSSNPARSGSAVAIYFNGAGELSPPRAAGDAPAFPMRQAHARMTIIRNGIEYPITYSGEVPGQPGLYQINFQPAGVFGGVSFVLGVGSSTAMFIIWVN